MLYTVKDRRSDYLPSFGILMDQQDAAAVFTTEKAARQYATSAGAMYRVVELRAHVLLDFLVRLKVEGIREIMVDPAGPNDPSPELIATQDLILSAADCIEDSIADAVPNRRAAYEELLTVTCPHCNRVERVSKEDTLPLCCGEVMGIATVDSRKGSEPGATISAR